MADNGAYLIVMGDLHLFCVGAQSFPEGDDLILGLWICVLGHDKTPAVVKKFGKSAFRARMLGACHRVHIRHRRAGLQ